MVKRESVQSRREPASSTDASFRFEYLTVVVLGQHLAGLLEH